MGDKGGSDLDVFDELVKKQPGASGPPLSMRGVPPLPPFATSSAPPPPPSAKGALPVAGRQKTLLGLPPPPPTAARPPAFPPLDGQGNGDGTPLPVADLAPELIVPALPPEPPMPLASDLTPPEPETSPELTPLPPPAALAPLAPPEPPKVSPTDATPLPPHPFAAPPAPPPIPGARVSMPVPPPPSSKLLSSAPPVPPPPAASPSAPRIPTLPPLPPPPATKAADPTASVDIDWDDDDEKTTVFDRPTSDSDATELAPMLMHPAAGSPPPLPPLPPGPPAPPVKAPTAASNVPTLAMPLLSVPPRSIPPRSVPAPRSIPASPVPAPTRAAASVSPLPAPPAARISRAASQPPLLPSARETVTSLGTASMPPGRRVAPMAAVAAVALLLLVALIMLVMPKSGTLIVTVAGPNNRRIDAVEVFVDGAKKCAFSPCKVEELEKGAHTIRVAAAGYADTADKVVDVGKETIVPLELARASEGTGIRVTAEGTGLKLFVDGKEVGPLPQELTDLTPGDHVIRVGGNDRFAPYEEHVSVETDKLKTIGPLQLKVVKGLATIEAGANAEGAKVLLVSGSERRPIPKLPIKLDIRTDKSYRLVAIKKGFANFSQPIEFEAGKAEKTFTVELTAGEAQQDAEPVQVASSSSHSARRVGGRSSSSAGSAAKGATGTLNINSIPTSTILLDGTPKGTTPKVGLTVSAGPHTVLFVNKGVRKAVSVNVPAGGKATAMTRF